MVYLKDFLPLAGTLLPKNPIHEKISPVYPPKYSFCGL